MADFISRPQKPLTPRGAFTPESGEITRIRQTSPFRASEHASCKDPPPQNDTRNMAGLLALGSSLCITLPGLAGPVAS